MAARTSPRTMSAIAAAVMVLLLAEEGCETKPLTYGSQWQGDFSNCVNAPADATIQTLGGDVAGNDREYGKVAMDYEGKDGCTNAYILDYQMPTPGTNVNPGWDWAWIHVASRMDGVDAAKCGELWTSLRVYGYWEYQGAAQQKLLLETYRRGKWNGFCDFGLPDNVWMSSAYTRVRAATQHGYTLAALKPHYSYFVTNNFPL